MTKILSMPVSGKIKSPMASENCSCLMAPIIMVLLRTDMLRAKDDSFIKEVPFTKDKSGTTWQKEKASWSMICKNTDIWVTGSTICPMEEAKKSGEMVLRTKEIF